MTREMLTGSIWERNSLQEMIPILVTGGAGYVGSHVCKRLHAAGYRPIVVDDLSRGHRWAVKWGPLEQGSILDEVFLDAVFSKWRPEGVMHFAALAYVGESFEDPLAYYRTNVVGTINLLSTMCRHGCDRLIFSSSCSTYGVPDSLPIDETAAQRPINPYGSTKLAAETAICETAIARGLRFVILRYFNAAGSDPESEIGEAHQPETHLVPLVLHVAAGLILEVKILGNDYATPDRTCVRDYVHVWDLAAAHVFALKYLRAGGSSEIFNLGIGQGYSVKEIITVAQRVTGKEIRVSVQPRRLGDPPQLICDPSKANQILGWYPERASLELQISDAWRWIRRSIPELNGRS
jgi:UDP-arabinose 4-epimerase